MVAPYLSYAVRRPSSAVRRALSVVRLPAQRHLVISSAARNLLFGGIDEKQVLRRRSPRNDSSLAGLKKILIGLVL